LLTYYNLIAIHPIFMIIQVKAKPAAKEEKIIKISEKEFEVWVKEPPIQGRANMAIIKALADYFKVSPVAVRIVSGYTSRFKIITVENQ